MLGYDKIILSQLSKYKVPLGTPHQIPFVWPAAQKKHGAMEKYLASKSARGGIFGFHVLNYHHPLKFNLLLEKFRTVYLFLLVLDNQYSLQ